MRLTIRNNHRWTTWLPGILVSMAVIIALAFLVDWGDFWASIRQVKITTVFILAVLSTVSLVFRSMAWRSLLENKLSLIDAFFCENIGYLLNNLLPFRMGEVARAVVGAERAGSSVGFVLPSIMVERLIDIGFAAMTLLVALPFVIGADFLSSSAYGAILMVGVVIALFILWMKFPLPLRRLVSRLFGRFPKMEKSFLNLLDQAHTGLQSSFRRKSIVTALFWLVLTWAGYWLSYFVAIKTAAPDAPFVWALFVGGVVSLGISIPSAPGNIGVWEAAFVGAMAILGVDSSLALASAVIMHLVAYLVTGAAGIAGIITFGESFHSIMMKVKKQKTTGEGSPMGEQP